MAEDKITKKDIEYARGETTQQCIARLDIEGTVQIGGFDLSSDSKVIIDTPFRDNSIWTGDIYSAGPSAAKYVKDGLEVWRNTLLVVAHKQYESGKLPSCVTLTLKYRGLSPFFDTYSMFWVVSAYDYLKRTKDSKFEKLFVRTVKKTLAYFATRLTKDGLYKTPFVDMYWNWTILRKKKSVHANALFYKVLCIAMEFGLDMPIDIGKFKHNFNDYFWSGRLYKEKNTSVIYLDGNSLALLFDLVPEDRKEVLLEALKYFETTRGPLSYKGKLFGVLPWHERIICPFLGYIHTLALQKEGKQRRANGVMLSTLKSGLEVAREYGKETIPEFWKTNGKLGAKPIIGKRRFIGLSLNADWSAFGDLPLN